MIRKLDFKIKKGQKSYLIPVEACFTHGRVFFSYKYNPAITEELKSMHGIQYHGYKEAPHREVALSVFGKDTIWSIEDNIRNRFQLEYLQGGNPYKVWDDFLAGKYEEPEFHRPLRAHQKELVCHGLNVHYAIWAAEMGTGKTLAAIEVMERSAATDIWYAAPKSALKAVEMDMRKWGCKANPQMMTYNELVKRMRNWKEGDKAPQFLVCDESQKVKTPTAQRTVASLALAEGVREDWGQDGYVILMSGSPAPKSPCDWWSQCEIAYPGFIKEGNITKFRNRLGLHELRESFAGGSFMERLTWLDDERKCAICGELADHIMHSKAGGSKWHPWQKSINEVERLYKRMKGLVVVKFKKDCLDLPEKQYRIITCPVMPSTVRAAKLITATSSTTAQALILLRELSDGFQYTEVPSGKEECPLCHGAKEMDDFEIKPEFAEMYASGILDDEGLSVSEYREKYFDCRRTTCTKCAGHGEVTRYTRDVERVPCPKDEAFEDVLEEHEDVGRLVVYAGFEGSVNRCVEIAQKQRWAVVKWDGKGIEIWNAEGTRLRVKSDGHKGVDHEGCVDPLVMFQEDLDSFPRVCFIGNAGAAGTGLTLTASPSILYFSNSFNADDRIQSEDRIHRMGMDVNRGATIIDLYHLPTDKYILDNLKEKKKLQDISMGDLKSVMSDEQVDEYLIDIRRK
jgi:hypothetical protein